MSGRHRRDGRSIWGGFFKALVEAYRAGVPDDESSEPTPVGSGATWPRSEASLAGRCVNGRPAGTRIVDEIEHDDERTCGGRRIKVVELVWNGGGRSFDVVDADTGEELNTECSFDGYPNDADLNELAEVIGGDRVG